MLSTRATLTSHPGSALAAMFDPDSGRPPALRDEDTGGAYFLDRNPDAFEVILEFLRTDKLFNPRGECGVWPRPRSSVGRERGS